MRVLPHLREKQTGMRVFEEVLSTDMLLGELNAEPPSDA